MAIIDLFRKGNKIRSQSIRELIRWTYSKNGNERKLAASSLGKLAKTNPEVSQAIPDLIRLLKDKKPQVRQYSVKALGKIGDVKVIPYVKELLDDKKTYVAKAAEISLAKLLKIKADLIKEETFPEESLKIEILTVRELTRYLKNLLESDKKLGNLFVRGEVSNLRQQISGHTYFTLKDEETQVKCVIFKRVNHNINFELKNGMKIILRGEIEIYEPRGEYNIIVEEMQPDGLGDLHLAYIQLKNKLEKEGLFSKVHKKPIPKFPKVVGIITSLSGAVLQDILNIIKRRYPIIKVVVVPAIVQGKESAASIVESIELINKLPKVDVVILGRGGGSLEDLWCFNEEIVARAIFNSTVPIVSAVGHETDFTIADFVADDRAPTPSAAAEKIVPDIKEIFENILHLKIRSAKSICNKLKLYNSDLKQIINRTVFKRPFEIVRSDYRELDQIAYKLQSIIVNKVNMKKKSLEIVESKLIVLNPEAILKRGYSIVINKDKIVRNSSDIKIGEDINIVLHKGKADAQVKKIWEE